MPFGPIGTPPAVAGVAEWEWDCSRRGLRPVPAGGSRTSGRACGWAGHTQDSRPHHGPSGLAICIGAAGSVAGRGEVMGVMEGSLGGKGRMVVWGILMGGGSQSPEAYVYHKN